MKNISSITRNFIGYTIGGILFVMLIPTIMWIFSGNPTLYPIPWWQLIIATFMAFLGLSLSIWSIVYMKCHGDGNPLDAFGHEIGERTQHLMTDGPYRLSRNPMLTGSFIYYLGICVWLWTWQSALVFCVFVLIMLIQVRTEEKRLKHDFGSEYDAYCRRTGRFW